MQGRLLKSVKKIVEENKRQIKKLKEENKRLKRKFIKTEIITPKEWELANKMIKDRK